MATSELDDLIDVGLTAYGRGDFYSALLAWEQALAISPKDTRARGYIDYVWQNLELLRGGGAERNVPLGMSGAPDDYDVEVDFGPPQGSPGRVDQVVEGLDEGWFLDDEPPAFTRNEALSAAPTSAPNQTSSPAPPSKGLGFVTANATGGPVVRTDSIPKIKIRTPGPGSYEPDVRARRDSAAVAEALAYTGSDELGPALGEMIEPTADVEAAKPTQDLGRGLSLDLDSYLSPDDLANEFPVSAAVASAVAPSPPPPQRESDMVAVARARTTTAEFRQRILAEVDIDAPAGESPSDRARRRIHALFERGTEAAAAGETERAVVAIDAALDEDPDSAVAQKLIHTHQARIQTVYQAYLGDLNQAPRLARALHTLSGEPLSARAAFLLSRIDGMCSYDELLDIAGMPRFEAMRHLCRLRMRGIIDAR